MPQFGAYLTIVIYDNKTLIVQATGEDSRNGSVSKQKPDCDAADLRPNLMPDDPINWPDVIKPFTLRR
jgi:hypothetical protein